MSVIDDDAAPDDSGARLREPLHQVADSRIQGRRGLQVPVSDFYRNRLQFKRLARFRKAAP